MTENQTRQSYKDLVARIRNEVGDNNELIKQIVGDYGEYERKAIERSFDARKLYLQHTFDSEGQATNALIQYGLQTLRWLFLLNAGVAGLILGYVGAKSGISTKDLSPVIHALWPFGIGCISVVLAGAVAYFNFGLINETRPSLPDAHQFLNVLEQPQHWPPPRGRKANETVEACFKRYNKWIDATRYAAIALGSVSVASFIGGIITIYRVL